MDGSQPMARQRRDLVLATGSDSPSRPGPTAGRDERWHRAARMAGLLSWASLVWMTAEGVVGLVAGLQAGSVALAGWALFSVVEGLAGGIVIWRLTADRTLSATAERSAQRAVAVSFWLLAPYVAIQSLHDLLTGHRPDAGVLGLVLGLVLTGLSLVIMPELGRAKHRLGAPLGSAATAGEGSHNLSCAALAARHSGRAGRQRAVRLVVARSGDRSRRRHRCRRGEQRDLARRGLLLMPSIPLLPAKEA